MKDGYPEESELKYISKFDLIKNDVLELIQYIQDRWKYADCGYFHLRGKRVLHLQLSTAGWSGNEDIIRALQKNYLFWGMYWQKSIRGGHYWFRIKRRKEWINK